MIDMNRFRQVTGTELPPAQQEPVSPYEGRSFAQLMLQDIPKWNSAMKLSIAKGDLAGARQYNDMIEDVSARYQEDWMQFAQSSGNHPVLSRMREGATELLSGNMGVNVFNAALASDEVQNRAIDVMYGPGELANTVKAARNKTDPLVASQSTELLQAIGAPIVNPGSVEDVEEIDQMTGQKVTHRRAAAPLPATAQSELNNRHAFVTKGLSVDGTDEGFMKSAGGISGYSANALKLHGAGGAGAGDELLQFTRQSVAEIADPAERAAAWASTVDMTARTIAKLNPSKDPLMTRTVTALLKTTQDALGKNGFSMKEAPVTASIQKALDINAKAVELTGQPVEADRMGQITTAFAKRNARKQLNDTDNSILQVFDQANTLKSGLTVGAIAGQPSGAEAFTMTMGADGKPVAVKNPALGGVDASHTLLKGYMDEALDAAPVIAAATGQDFNTVLKDTMEDKLSERVLQMFGGKTQDKTMKYAKSEKGVVDQMRANTSLTVKDTDEGYEVTSKGKLVDRNMARGMSRLMATRMLETGTFDVNNVYGELMNIPDIGNQLAKETQAAITRSVEAGKVTPALQAFGELAVGSMKGDFGRGIVKEITDNVTGDYTELKTLATGGTGVWNKTESVVKDRISKTDVAKAWKADSSDAFGYLVDNVSGTDELQKILEAKPGGNAKLDMAAKAFVDQVLSTAGADFFKGPSSGEALNGLAYGYVKRHAAALLNRFESNQEARSGLGGANPLTLGGLLGPQRANWDLETEKLGEAGLKNMAKGLAMTAAVQPVLSAQSLLVDYKAEKEKIKRPDFSGDIARIITEEIAGGRKQEFQNGEALFTRMLNNLHNRAAQRITSAAPAENTSVQQDAPVNVALLRELPLDKVAMADILQAAQMLDAKNDETIVYKNAESMLDSLNEKNFGPYAAETRAKGQNALKDIKTRPFSEIMRDFTKAQEEGGAKYRTLIDQQRLAARKEELLMRKEVEGQMSFDTPPVEVPK